MEVEMQTAPAERAGAEHLEHRTPADQTSERLYSPAVDPHQLSPGVRRVLDALAALGPADRATVAGLFVARVVAAEAEAELTPKEVAFKVGVTSSTVRTWCASGRLGRRVGGRYRITHAEVRALWEVAR